MSQAMSQPESVQPNDVTTEIMSLAGRSFRKLAGLAIGGSLAVTAYDYLDDGVGTLDNPVSKATVGVMLATASISFVKTAGALTWDRMQSRADESFTQRSNAYHARQQDRYRSQRRPSDQ